MTDDNSERSQTPLASNPADLLRRIQLSIDGFARGERVSSWVNTELLKEASAEIERLSAAVNEGAMGCCQLIKEDMTAEIERLKGRCEALNSNAVVRRLEIERNRLRALLSDVLPQHIDQPRDWTGEWNGSEERDWSRRVSEALSGKLASAHETGAQPAIALLERELKADRCYAWSWHCNIAVPLMDQFGCSHESANRSAAELMRHLFHVDVTTFPEWKAFQWNQDKCECGCCLPPPGEVCAGCGKRAPLKASGEPTSGSGCPACGVMYVAGARHFSGCPLHPGEAV